MEKIELSSAKSFTLGSKPPTKSFRSRTDDRCGESLEVLGQADIVVVEVKTQVKSCSETYAIIKRKRIRNYLPVTRRCKHNLE